MKREERKDMYERVVQEVTAEIEKGASMTSACQRVAVRHDCAYIHVWRIYKQKLKLQKVISAARAAEKKEEES